MSADKKHADDLVVLLAEYDDLLAGDTDAGSDQPSHRIAGTPNTPDWESAKEVIELLDRVRRRWMPDTSAERDETPIAGPSVETPRSARGDAFTVGGYQIERELGRGGLGVVYLARDERLSRLVALKVPRLESLARSGLRERFLREAEAAARLNHPNLVTVYEAGEEGTICYLASEYCHGPTLAQYLESRGTPLSAREAARLVHDLAAGVQHAHGRGVLHRDIKPSNVLLVRGNVSDESVAEGELRPKLTDFGMAKLLEQTSDLTRTGVPIGTPAYMSPEQAAGRVHDLDARTDVYALGAILYELLTLRRVVTGETDGEILRKLMFDEPISPRRQHAGVPRDLEAICLKCLEKDVRRRYTTADQLADDLRRFLEGRPTEARPIGAVGMFFRWTRRRPAVAALWIGAAGAAFTLLAVVLIYSAQLTRANANLRAEQARALASELESREYAYGASIKLAQEAWNNASPLEARALLEQQIPKPGQTDLRRFEWRYLHHRFNRDSAVIAQQDSFIWSLAVSPDDSIVAAGDHLGMIRLYDRERRTLLRELRGHDVTYVDRLVFAEGGKTLISAGNDRTIRWWDVASGKPLLVSREHQDWVGGLALSPDGTWLVSGDGQGHVLLWNAVSRTLERELYKHPAAVSWIVFHPVKPWLFSGCEDGEIRIWDYQAGAPPKEHPSSLFDTTEPARWRDAVFLADGGSLFVGNRNHILRWTFTDDASFMTFSRYDHPVEGAQSLTFLPSVNRLAQGGSTIPTIVLRKPSAARRPHHVLSGHSDAVRCLVGLNHQPLLLSGSKDGSVREWDVQRIEKGATAIEVRDETTMLAWSPDGDRLWIKQANKQVFSVDRPHDPIVIEWSQAIADARWLFPLPDKRLLGVTGDYEVYLLKERPPVRVPLNIPPDARCVAASRMGEVLAYTQGKQLKLHDVASGAIKWQTSLDSNILRLCFLKNGSLVAGSENMVVRLSGSDGKVLARSEPYRGGITSIDESHDEGRLVTMSNDRNVRLLDARTLKQLSVLSRPTRPDHVWFFDNDRRLFESSGQTATIIDPDTGQDLLHFDHPGTCLSPDDRWLAVPDGTQVRLIDLQVP